MNTWAYLFLIVVLVLLAGAMLYARFSGRTREKSLHHAPSDLILSAGLVEAGVFPGRVLEDDARLTEEISSSEMTSDVPDGLGAAPKVELAPLAAAPARDREDDRRERDYFDELQEAAAGLAKLMRSSPVERPEPVVFAPSEVEEALVPVGTEEGDGADFIEAIAVVEAPGETETETETDFDWLAAAEVSLRVLSPRELLGDVVFSQFDEIDEELDALEALVGSIETSLRLLSEDEFESSVVTERSGLDAEVSEAA